MAKQIKRIISVLMLAAAALVLVFGPRAETYPAKDRVVVQYWEKWTGKEAEQMQEIVDWFNDTVGEQKGIYVQYLSMSNVSQKTLVSTAAGVPPDVAGLWDGEVCPFAGIGAMEPLDELAGEKGITSSYYKPAFWRACQYDGRLYALVSTPGLVALHYDKQAFHDRAAQIRAAGLDPDRPPRTLEELDRYAQAMEVFETMPSGARRMVSAGYLPMEPGWYITLTGYWFGASMFDEGAGTLRLNAPAMVEALTWVQSYSRRLGIETMGEFRSGFGQFNSTQNPFLTGTVAMIQQGPWLANYIENLMPSMNHWKFPKEQEQGFSVKQRRENCQWGVAAFPSAVAGLENVTYCAFDTLMIPKGARHPREAFEFIAFVNRQDVMEKLCTLHCKNSPLANVSASFILNHPNPYIEVFERLAWSPNAHGLPKVAVWPQISDELNNAIQEVYLMRSEPKQALDAAQARGEGLYEKFMRLQRLRKSQ